MSDSLLHDYAIWKKTGLCGGSKHKLEFFKTDPSEEQLIAVTGIKQNTILVLYAVALVYLAAGIGMGLFVGV